MITDQTPEATFSEPQRQSPAALVIMLVKVAGFFLKIMWPAILVTLFSGNDDEGRASRTDKIAIMFGVLGALSLVAAIIKYLYYRFYISEGNFIIKSGWLIKKVTSIPLQNVTAVHLEQHVLHRILQVGKVSLDSSGSEKTEVSIDALSLRKAEELKSFLLNKTIINNKDETAEQPKYQQSKLSFKDLIVLSLTANHIEAFFLLIALSINVWDDLHQAFKLDESKWIDEHAALLQSSIVVTSMIIVAILLISIIYSILRTLLKFFDFTITNEPNGWRIAYGLTNHQQKFLPFAKIQVLQWQSNFVRRKFDIWIMHFLSAGYSELKKKQKVQIPVLKFASAADLAGCYQTSQVFNPETGNTISKAYWIRGLIYIGFIFGLIPAIVVSFWLPWVGIGWLLLNIYIVIHQFIYQKVFRWQVNEEGLQLFIGVWGRKYSLMKWSKVQQVNLTQNLFQKRRGLANITFMTAGGQVVLPYIPLADAKLIVDQVLYLVESKNEMWM